MKKKIIKTFLILSIIFMPVFVQASTKCSYRWFKDKGVFTTDTKVILQTEDNPKKLTKITTSNQNVNFSNFNGFDLKSDGSCPDVFFHHANMAGTNDIYDSLEACQKDHSITDEDCMVGIEKEKIDDDKGGENIIKKTQATLTSSSDNFCEYRHNYDDGTSDTFKITLDDDRVKISCSTSSYGLGACQIENGGSFFKPDDFKCVGFIYYNARSDEAVKYCSIVGVGGKNTSNEGDEDISDEGDVGETDPFKPSEWDTGDIDANMIFCGRFGEFLQKVLDIIRFAVPLIIIGLSVLDFIKVIASQKADDMKKATNKLVKRLIIGVAIFIVPTILEFLLSQFGMELGSCVR